LPLLVKARSLIVVIQDTLGLENSSELASGLVELRAVVRYFDLKPDGVMVNDANSVYTALADEFFINGESLKTQKDEERWLRELTGFASQYTDSVAKLIRAVRSVNDTMENMV